MAGTSLTDPPSVTLSFANNFWGKEDAGVSPLLERMHNAKVTGDEMKSFYTARAQIEEDYARKLLNLARKPLGSSEGGTLKLSLDSVRSEMESMGKAHQQIASQMKSELEEQLSAFAGGIKERRKIIQAGIEKLLKVKMQQTAAVNKSRDRYEQDCLKIKGYLAQGHMVMGQEERKNKAKLEKTKIQISTSSQEYEQAVKVLGDTTERWNREWKKACDGFQDLEEERIDFMKSSLWQFANISSTVCEIDDAALERIRLSLEDCDVQKDITNFIKDSGTGQEIPDAPKFIDFCRGDADDVSETSEDNSYSVAQFQRTMNPAFRSSSPQPSVYESHHDPNNPLARELGHKDLHGTAPHPVQEPSRRSYSQAQALQQQYTNQYGDIPSIPHNAYPTDGMTQFCRIAPPSERSSTVPSPVRPDSRDSRSDYSNPNSFTSGEAFSGAPSPVKQLEDPVSAGPGDRSILKKRSGIFQGRSPFKKKDKDPEPAPLTNGRNTWSTQQPLYSRQTRVSMIAGNTRASPSPDPEPVDPRANFQLNVGKNVFDVAPSPKKSPTKPPNDDGDILAQALAELKGGGSKKSASRITADRYAGISRTPVSRTPAPDLDPPPALGQAGLNAAKSGTPPPSYEQPVSLLSAPRSAHTAKQMQQTTQKYVSQTQKMFSPRSSGGSAHSAPRTSTDIPRALSPGINRGTSPRPGLHEAQQGMRSPPHVQARIHRGASPNHFAAPTANRPRAQSSSPIKPRANDAYWMNNAPANVPRALSPNPQFSRPGTRGGATSPAPHFGGRPTSSHSSGGDMALQLTPTTSGSTYGGGSQRGGMPPASRPMSSYGGSNGGGALSTRVRSKSVAEARPQTMVQPDPRVLHYARAMYPYTAQIPEELSFAKHDILAILREQDDGWWAAEVVGGQPGAYGLVPSNYLQNC
ncbi:uncharacterized protein IWZ02DRAFT_300526 [Phyllosticta citriasiana]|uniref:Septation protein imp2 n=1 Tax=Phyllosticta citriasiana TaxID=595635 RepID=A0ABR1KKU6_9PEZI